MTKKRIQDILKAMFRKTHNATVRKVLVKLIDKCS